MFEEIFHDLGEGFRLQETPMGYYILWEGSYIKHGDGPLAVFPTRAIALEHVEICKMARKERGLGVPFVPPDPKPRSRLRSRLLSRGLPWSS